MTVVFISFHHHFIPNAYSAVCICRHHGAHERSRGCSEKHQQCWEAWETPGPHQALLQGHCALPNRHDEARWVVVSSNISVSEWRTGNSYWKEMQSSNGFTFDGNGGQQWAKVLELLSLVVSNMSLFVRQVKGISNSLPHELFRLHIQVTLVSLRSSTTTEPGKLSSISQAGWTR